MAKKRNRNPAATDAWRHAKKVCRLEARHVEMARALGMNPKKLPRLRPSAHQKWKQPVGEFIEECYRKRFGHGPREPSPSEPLECQPLEDEFVPDDDIPF